MPELHDSMVRPEDAEATERLLERLRAEPTPAPLPVREALVIRPGDHLIVRIDADITLDDAAHIRQHLRERMPLLSDVTVVNAAQLYVLRNEVVDRG